MFETGTSTSTTGSHEVHRVVVTGGTHGNEYTGVYVINRLKARPDLLSSYRSLAVETVLTNERALSENKRYIDEDLNRLFSMERLAETATTAEAKRAAELNEQLGPKGSASACDLIIDLHTTTGNMGATIIVDRWCPLALHAAAFVQAEMAADDVHVHIMYYELDKPEAPSLASIGKAGLRIEVGPTPQGVLRHDVVQSTERVLHSLLSFFERRNAGEHLPLPNTISVFATAGSNAKIAWPVDDDGFPTALVHASRQDRDWVPISVGDPLFETLGGEVICYQGEFGPTAVPIFVNEGGYYGKSSGRGIGFAVERVVKLVPDSCPRMQPCEIVT